MQEHGVVCMACGYVPPMARELEAHEIHSYPGSGVIKLETIVLLCRKCHHTVHLERSVSWARDRARWKWESENRAPRNLKVLQAMGVEADEAAATYREEMLAHYCKVNRVTRRRCERDYENALPPDDIKQLGADFRSRGRTTLARMDYGPFEDEVKKTRARIAERREREEITQLWNRMTPEERLQFDGPEDFADWLSDQEDVGFELLPDHECPWDTAMWRDTFG